MSTVAAVQRELIIATAVQKRFRSLNFASCFRFCVSNFDCVFRVSFRDRDFQVFSYFLQADDEKLHWDTITSLYAINP